MKDGITHIYFEPLPLILAYRILQFHAPAGSLSSEAFDREFAITCICIYHEPLELFAFAGFINSDITHSAFSPVGHVAPT